jgi:hypothetical protein
MQIRLLCVIFRIVTLHCCIWFKLCCPLLLLLSFVNFRTPPTSSLGTRLMVLVVACIVSSRSHVSCRPLLRRLVHGLRLCCFDMTICVFLSPACVCVCLHLHAFVHACRCPLLAVSCCDMSPRLRVCVGVLLKCASVLGHVVTR